MHLPFESGIGTGGAPLTAHLLQVTADRLHRMAIHAHFDGIHTTRRADAWSPSAPGSAALPFPPGCAPHQQRGWRRYRPTAAPRRADQTHPPVPPRAGGSGGGQVVQPRGSHLNAHGPAIRSADEMHTPSEELLPFGGAFPTEGAPAHVPTAPGARPAARRQGKAVDDEPVARGDAPPTFAGIQTIPSAS